MGFKKRDYREKKEPIWKCRIEGNIEKLRQDVNLLTRGLKEELGSIYEKYRVKRKGLKTVIEELKQRMLAKSAKVKRYDQRIEQFRQNRIFDSTKRRSTRN